MATQPNSSFAGKIYRWLRLPAKGIKIVRNLVVFIADVFLIIVAALGSFALRTDLGLRFLDYLPQIYWLVAVAVLIKPTVFYFFGLYRRLWAYASVQELRLIVVAVSSASMLISVVIITLLAANILPNFPRSIPPIDWLLTLVLIGGFRFSLRVLAEMRAGQSSPQSSQKRVLVVGAGDAGALVVREMQKNPQLNLSPVCFVDDDSSKQKQHIHDVPVEGTLNDIGRLVDARRIQEVIIAIPSAPGRVIRQGTESCRQKGVHFRTMPGIYELIGGKINVGRLREVEITDLLRRAPVQIDENLIGASLSGRRVLVTGAGGSIGRELCRQIA